MAGNRDDTREGISGSVGAAHTGDDAAPDAGGDAVPFALDHAACYRAVRSRDTRFDGLFFTAVHSTGIFCRPGCTSRTPAEEGVTFYRSAAAAQAAGYRACKRCRPYAAPGDPSWDIAADLTGRAMRAIADGVVDREGVEGLARRLGCTPRHLARVMSARLGASPIALARARRTQTARVLLETTALTVTEAAFASGFASVRQFNDTMREAYAMTPTQLRAASGGRREVSARTGARGAGAESSTHGGPSGRHSGDRAPSKISVGATPPLDVSIPVRTPFAGHWIAQFLAKRTIVGVEHLDGGTYSRTLSLPHGPGIVRIELIDVDEAGPVARVPVRLELTDVRDIGAAMERVRRLIDADCDPLAVLDDLGRDADLGPLVRRLPGRRVPGHVDGDEIAVRAIFGQQITVAAATRAATALTERIGTPLPAPSGTLTHLFPTAAQVAAVDPALLKMPRSRAQAMITLCAALADGTISLDRSADRARVRAQMLALRGIGPWTVDYIAMRALGDPDVILKGDVGTRDGMRAVGIDPATLVERSAAWAPWRSYAQMHLWGALYPPATTSRERDDTGAPTVAGKNVPGRL